MLGITPKRVLLSLLFLITWWGVQAGLSTHALAPLGSAAAGDIRNSVLAGTWYPSDAQALRKQIEAFLQNVPSSPPQGELKGIVVPHAGYVYSGQVAAYAYQLLRGRSFDTVVILSPSHHTRFSGVAAYEGSGFQTPLGVVPLDTKFIAALKRHAPAMIYNSEAHSQEHAIEIQLPFLQSVLKRFKLVPLIMGDQDFSTCQWLADALTEEIGKKSVLIVASSDLSHYHPYDRAKQLDDVLIQRLQAYDPRGLMDQLQRGTCEACGGGPIVAAMLATHQLGANRTQILQYANSGDVTGRKDDPGGVVGYVAAAFWKANA